MAPNHSSTNHTNISPDFRQSTGLVISPDCHLITLSTKSAHLNRRHNVTKAGASPCLGISQSKRNTSFPMIAVKSSSSRVAGSAGRPLLKRRKSLPEQAVTTNKGSKNNLKNCDGNFLKTVDGHNVTIKKVIKYCRNLDSVDATKNVSTSKKYGEIIKEKRKIYLSEGLNKKEKKGFMGVPPATPTHDYLSEVQYIQCLADMKGKRRLTTKLSEIVKFRQEQKKKEDQETKKLKIIADKKHQEILKVTQRNQIYALNKVMKELESSRFDEYRSKRTPSSNSNTVTSFGGV